MATAFVPSSSEYACDNIARRLVRNAKGQTFEQQTSAFINPFLKPIALRLAKAGRLQRGVLPKMVATLGKQLAESENVFALETESFQKKKLSSNESFRIAFKMPSSQDEEFLAFTATECNLNRRQVTVGYTHTDIYVHRHAVSRFMQREAKPPEEMFQMLSGAIDLATVIAWRVAAHKSKDRNIAIPFGDGMLFGRVDMFKGGYKRGIFDITSDHAEHHEEDRTPGFDVMMQVKLLTYVDNNSLTESRTALRARISEVWHDNALAIKLAADSSYFTRLVVPSDLPESQIKPLIDATRPSLDKLLDSTEWCQFVATVGQHG